MPRPSTQHGPTTADSLREYGRGIAGGFLFSLPLILTMEMWDAGAVIPPARLAAGLLATFVLLCGYNAYAGLRYDSSFREVVIDSIEELGIGLVLSVAVMFLLGRVNAASATAEVLGLVVVEGLFVAVGVSVGTAQLSGAGGKDSGMPKGRQETLSSELVLAFCGAVLIAANVAPTEEILVLASSMSSLQLVGVLSASIALAATLLFYSDFTGSARFAGNRGLVGVIHGTAITYAAALIASAGILWFFGRFHQHALALGVAQCVVLGFVGTLGASAGRLLLR
ncbi:MAG: TIGR02587 family membrane protein [Acidobacteria bacterium]|nr:TIGR02587 family membrane protein [Acidobacteriota bacterium]